MSKPKYSALSQFSKEEALREALKNLIEESKGQSSSASMDDTLVLLNKFNVGDNNFYHALQITVKGRIDLFNYLIGKIKDFDQIQKILIQTYQNYQGKEGEEGEDKIIIALHEKADQLNYNPLTDLIQSTEDRAERHKLARKIITVMSRLNLDFNHKDKNGSAALTHAVRYRVYDLAAIIANQKDINLEIVDDNNSKPIDYLLRDEKRGLELTEEQLALKNLLQSPTHSSSKTSYHLSSPISTAFPTFSALLKDDKNKNNERSST